LASNLADPLAHLRGLFDRGKDFTPTSVSEFIEGTPRNSMPRWLWRGQTRFADPVPAIDRKDAAKMWLPDRGRRTAREQLALDHFIRLARPLISSPPATVGAIWEWMAIARHYGVPTRLLDWTDNALAALYFAVEEPNGNKDSVVFGLQAELPDASRWESTNSAGLGVYRPPHLAARIGAQASVFTVHPDDFCQHNPETAEPLASWPDAWPGHKMRITIPAAHRVKIRSDLLDLGIHRYSMFLDLDGAGVHVRREYFGQEDMDSPFDIAQQFKRLFPTKESV